MIDCMSEGPDARSSLSCACALQDDLSRTAVLAKVLKLRDSKDSKVSLQPAAALCQLSACWQSKPVSVIHDMSASQLMKPQLMQA